MERDVFMNVVVTGAELRTVGFTSRWIKPHETYITLVLDEAHAGWSMAAAVAQAVDKELGISADLDRVALAMDSKNVVVVLPEHQRGDPASWIRDVERTPILMESNEARVTINRNSGTIVITGDTRLSPVIVSQKGLTVTVANPLPDGTVPRPAFEEEDFVALDSEADRRPQVRDLLEALNRLKVPFEERVSILEEIHRAGKLHARLLYEG
jgi:flagellar P-ring protein precursor FlgI